MKERTGIPFFSDVSGPLPTLSGAILLIGATSRFSYALILCAAVLTVYLAVPAIVQFASSAIPAAHATFIRAVIASTVAGLFALGAGAFWPLLVRELGLYLMAVPLSLMASGLLDRTEAAGKLRALQLSAYEAVNLCVLAVAFSLVREPLGFGVLSVPAPDGIAAVVGNEKNASAALVVFSSAAGGFILFGYVLALFRRIRFLLIAKPCGEDER